MTSTSSSTITSWLVGRLPDAWTATPAEMSVDRDEITIMLTVSEPELDRDATDADRAEALAGRVTGFDRKVAWGVVVGDRTELFTHLAVPVMTRLRQPERMVLDTLVSANVARSRADALAWCVRLVGEHTGDWLIELRDAMQAVDRLRAEGPTT
jgi:hypothetical protein